MCVMTADITFASLAATDGEAVVVTSCRWRPCVIQLIILPQQSNQLGHIGIPLHPSTPKMDLLVFMCEIRF